MRSFRVRGYPHGFVVRAAGSATIGKYRSVLYASLLLNQFHTHRSMKKYLVAASSAFALPLVALAQTTTSLEGVLAILARLINLAIPVLIGASVLVFIWGLFIYMTNVGDEEKQKEGKSIMIWGIIALFVMFSVFGLVNLLIGTFQLNNQAIPVPVVPLR